MLEVFFDPTKGAIFGFVVLKLVKSVLPIQRCTMYIQKARHPLCYKIILIFTRPSTWQASWYCGIQTCSFGWNPAIKIFSKDSQLVLGSLLSCQPCLGTLICGRWDWLWSISDWELDAGCLGPSTKSGIFAPPPGPAGGNEAELCTRGVGYNLLPPGPGRGLGV